MKRMIVTTACAAVTVGLSSAAFGGPIWAEVGDAGDFPIGAFQDTVGVGPLTAIDGSMAWEAAGDHVDAFCITVTDEDGFFASLDPSDGGFFLDDGGFEDDSRLYLFEMDGTMVMANDDKPGFSLESYLSNPSTFPGGLTNNPGSVVAGNQYILAVTYFSNDLLDAAGTPLASFSPFGDLHGINPASDGVGASWENNGDFDISWDYRIALGGATFSTIPGPASVAVFGLAGLLIGRRRR